MVKIKVFYINLEHRTDRKHNVNKQIQKIGLQHKLERIDGINGNMLDIKNISSDIISDKGKEDALKKELKVYIPLTRGAIGCALSHKKVYQKIIDDDLDYAIILEDDILIKNDFIKKLKIILKNTPDDFDMLFLGYHKSTLDYPSYKLNNYIWEHTRVYGLFSYIVSKTGAQKLLKIFPITTQIDSEISDNLHKFKSYIVSPKNRIILSDESSVSTTFGTDIQIRENFSDIHVNNNNIIIPIMIIIFFITIFIYITKYISHK